MKRVFLAVAFLILLATSGIAWLEARRAQMAADARAEIARENRRTKETVRTLEQRVARAEEEQAGRRSAAERRTRSQTFPVSGTPVPSPASVQAASLLKKSQEMLNEPNAQGVRLASARARLVSSHGVFFRRLALTPTQIERFQDIAARRQEQEGDLNEILRLEAQSNSIISNETWGAVSKLQNQVRADYEAGQRELLGDDGYRQLREYERTVETRKLASGWAGVAAVAGVPLTAEQAEQLTQVLANASTAYRDGGSSSTWTIDWKAADEQARGILSSTQWEVFQAIEPPNSAGGRISKRFSDAVAEAAKAEQEMKQAAGPPPSGG